MRKPIYTEWRFWVIIVVIVLGIAIAAAIKQRQEQAQDSPPSPSPPAAAGTQLPSQVTAPTPSATVAPGASAANPASSPPDVTPSADTQPVTPPPSAYPGQTSPADQVPLPKSDVLAYSRQLKGSPYIRDVAVGTDNIEIHYFGSFAEFAQANPGTQKTKADYNEYFSSRDAINKILMEAPVQLFRQFPGTASIDISLPFSGKTYSVSLTKGSVEKFFNTDLDGIETDEQWAEQISGPYFNKEYRDQFAERYIKVN
ncbi:hypothetical protein [Paenibacillus sabinae]|uniref:Uncharacterized protein n=1 Tax=Paenibacillus sabinae T27 TaxID=1268072 RepID=X5A087_9BACL|nr:hypothetical protein [Paenibacillus sabinae]AHV97289.1 hypothetical protein PSAB_11805 [Paenibacillus sabinae T27]